MSSTLQHGGATSAQCRLLQGGTTSHGPADPCTRRLWGDTVDTWFYVELAELPGFTRDSCSTIIHICAFYFSKIYFNFFTLQVMALQTFEILPPKTGKCPTFSEFTLGKFCLAHDYFYEILHVSVPTLVPIGSQGAMCIHPE